MHTKEPTLYWNCKIIQYGDFTELYEYGRVFKENFKKVIYENKEKIEKKVQDYNMERAIFSVNRSKKTIRRLLEQNFTNKKNVSFLTLTFAENLTDVKTANIYFKKFIRQLRRFDSSVSYLAVIEFQKRGAVHYHVVLSAPFIPREKMCKMWSYGSWDLHKLRKIKSISAYVTKYISKGLFDSRFAGIKVFQRSKNLIAPRVFKWIKWIKTKGDLTLNSAQLIHSGEYLTSYCGLLKFRIYKGIDDLLVTNLLT